MTLTGRFPIVSPVRAIARNSAIFFGLTFFFISAACAERLRVTAVAPSTSGFSITLNGAIVLRDIALAGGPGNRRLVFPVHVARSGAEFPQIDVESPSLYQDILRAVLDGRIEAVSPEPWPPVFVREPEWIGHPVRRANVPVSIGGAITVWAGVVVHRARREVVPSGAPSAESVISSKKKGSRKGRRRNANRSRVRSPEEYRVVFPSGPIPEGRYGERVAFLDPALKRSLEKKILRKFHRMLSERALAPARRTASRKRATRRAPTDGDIHAD